MKDCGRPTPELRSLPRTQLAKLVGLNAFEGCPKTSSMGWSPYIRLWKPFEEEALELASSVEATGWLARCPGLAPGALVRAVRATAPLMRLARPADGWLTVGTFAFALAHPRCAELVESAPAVAVAFLEVALQADEFFDLDFGEILRRLRERAGHPRRDVVRDVGYPAEALRVLQKVPATSVALAQVRALRERRIPPAAWRRLRHLPRVTATAIELATNERLAPHVGPRLLLEAATGEDRMREALDLDECLTLADRMGRSERVREVNSGGSLWRLRARLRQEADRHARMRSVERLRAPFPEPPIVGTTEIEPLRTPLDLAREGVEMSHCVARYRHDVELGTLYVYRVLAPERATLAIAPDAAEGRWVVSQMRLATNGQPRAESYAAVSRWLDAA